MKKILLIMCSIMCLSVGSINATYTYTFKNRTKENIPIWLYVSFTGCEGKHSRIEPGKDWSFDKGLCCLSHIDLILDGSHSQRTIFDRHWSFTYCGDYTTTVTSLDTCIISGGSHENDHLYDHGTFKEKIPRQNR